MPSREFAMLVEESSYGTPVGSPTKGTNLFYPRLHEADAFTGQMNPVPLDIMYGGGRATPAVRVNDQYVVPFTLKSYLYPGAYSAMLLNWCMTIINSGRTTPWTTTDAGSVMPVGDLASMGIYHAITQNDGTTIDRRLYSGCKVHTFTISCSRQDPRAMLTISGFGIRDDKNAAGSTAYPDATEFPAPAETDYPTAPYLFSQSAGNVVNINTGSTARTQYSSVSLTVTNAMDRQHFESKYLSLDKFCGRSSTFSIDLHLKATPDDLAFLQAQTALKNSLKFDNGTNTLKIDFLTNNYLNTLGRNLPLNGVFHRTTVTQNFWDTSSGNDITLTTT